MSIVFIYFVGIIILEKMVKCEKQLLKKKN